MAHPSHRRTRRGGHRTDGSVSRRRGGSDRLLELLRPLRRGLGRIETATITRFGRSLISVLYRTPVLVLHTVGRRSGRPRATALAHARPADLVDSDPAGMDPVRDRGQRNGGPTSGEAPPREMVWIVGGASGQRRLPDWVANVRADDRVEVDIDGQRRRGRAVEVHGPERKRIWDQLTRIWPRIERYEARAGRPVPVFRLSIDSDQEVAGGS